MDWIQRGDTCNSGKPDLALKYHMTLKLLDEYCIKNNIDIVYETDSS